MWLFQGQKWIDETSVELNRLHGVGGISSVYYLCYRLCTVCVRKLIRESRKRTE